MIHELRIYTVQPGTAPKFLKHVEEVGLPIRGNDYGRLEGYWFTEIGPLNRVVHLWSHDDLNTRAEARAGLAANKAWTGEFVPLIRPLLRNQEVKLMHPRLPIKPPAKKGNVYEYRYYQTRMGAAPEFIAAISEAMPVRERHSQNCGLWHTEAGLPNEVSHLWVYEDAADRARARAAAAQDPDWQAFLAKGGPLLEEMSSMLLVPAPFSPLG